MGLGWILYRNGIPFEIIEDSGYAKLRLDDWRRWDEKSEFTLSENPVPLILCD